MQAALYFLQNGTDALLLFICLKCTNCNILPNLVKKNLAFAVEECGKLSTSKNAGK